MKLVKNNRHLIIGAFLLMPCYLCIVVMHLFFLPSFKNDAVAGSRPSFTRNIQTVYYLVRNDRSMWKQNPGVKILPKVKSIAQVIVFAEIAPVKTISISETCLASNAVTGRYAWLYTRSIRT